MEAIGQTLQKLKTSTSANTLAPLSSAAVGHLFGELANMLGAAALGRMFAAGREAVIDPNARPGTEPQWVQDVRRTWAEHLAGFSRRELERGLAAVSESKFTPTLPEFKRLCRPCLDPEVAWWEAEHCLNQRKQGLAGDWSHPALWRAARQMSGEILNGDFARHRARWTVLLKRELAKGVGEGLPEAQRQIEAAPHRWRPPTPEEKAEHDALKARIRAAAAPKEDADEHQAT